MLGLFCLVLVGVSPFADALLTCPPSSQGSAIKRLKSSLFCDYDPHERPVKNREDNVTINFYLGPRYLSFVDNLNKYEFSSYFIMSWNDEFLTWEPEDFENITNIFVPSNEMWFPDIYILSSDMKQLELHGDNWCEVKSSGLVKCVPSVNTLVYCELKLTHWPLDKQICTFGIISYFFSIEYVDLQFDEKGYVFEFDFESKDWTVFNMNVSRKVHTYPNFTYPELGFTFHLQRYGGLNAIIVIAPAFAITILTLLSFWVQGITCRICLCCTSLLGDILCLFYIGSHINASGKSTPNIALFYRDSMLVTIFTLVLGVCVERLKDRTSVIHVPAWLVNGVSWLQVRGGRAGQLLLGDDETTETSNIEDDKSVIKCSKFVTLFQRITFLILLFTYFVMLVTLFP